ncbi:MAG: hypothetical protein C4532_17280 [Candidatus Abyssobacteria bacterium SURF_17]|uniref:Uncharacterized protein n=1 Tax=Candidatus Abyssobacteria bacterium SURF_17 TaxID=2093361 RepID=A0A419ER40_9BACT|nr:MAG: hypothetical protein C4532_17280 [Candidatus Abyssubacteria bacterium SURF_17]
MEEENRNSAEEDKEYRQKQAEAAFCEELLRCCRCGKIYFSRYPITLPTFSRNVFHVCMTCSRALKCSICGRSMPPESALVTENLPKAPIGLLCPRCRERALMRIRPFSRNVPVRLRALVTSAVNALVNFVRKVTRL